MISIPATVPPIIALMMQYYGWSPAHPRHGLRFADFGIGTNESTNWCGAGLACFAKPLGLPIPSNPQVARNWDEVGKPVTRPPRIGDLIILWRGSEGDWRGHVTVYVAPCLNPINFYAIGCNQQSMVSIARQPTSRILAVREWG